MIRFCFSWLLALAFYGTTVAQVQVLTCKYFYEVDNYDDCIFSKFDAKIPRFVADKNDSTIKTVNDAVRHWFRNTNELPDENSFVAQHGDTLDKYFMSVSHDTNTCPGVTARPEITTIGYTVWMNSSQLLSFSMRNEWTAGSNGIGYSGITETFTYDRKHACRLSLDSLLKPGADSVLNHISDSLFSLEVTEQLYGRSWETSTFALSDTALIVWRGYEWSGSKGAMIEVQVPWKLLRNYLTPAYRKLFHV